MARACTATVASTASTDSTRSPMVMASLRSISTPLIRTRALSGSIDRRRNWIRSTMAATESTVEYRAPSSPNCLTTTFAARRPRAMSPAASRPAPAYARPARLSTACPPSRRRTSLPEKSTRRSMTARALVRSPPPTWRRGSGREPVECTSTTCTPRCCTSSAGADDPRPGTLTRRTARRQDWRALGQAVPAAAAWMAYGAYWSRKLSRSFSDCPAVLLAGAIRAISLSDSPVATTAAWSGVKTAV